MKGQTAVFLACFALAASAPTSSQDSLNELCKVHGHGSTLVHPTDCTKFIQCVGELANVLSCPNDLYFDIATVSCEYDKAVCDHKAQGNTDHSSDHSSDHSNHQSNGHTGNKNDFNGACDNQPNGALLAHPDDCGKFIQCVWGEPKELSCPAGLHFDTKAKVCNYPDQAGCEESSNHKVDTGKQTLSASVDADLVNACVGKSNGALVPHPHDCSKFLYCLGTPVVRDCPATLHFNPKLKVCDWPASAGCTSTPSVPTTPTTPVDPTGPLVDPRGPCYGKPDGTFVADPSDPTKFLSCLTSIGHPLNCPPGLHFNGSSCSR